MLRNFAKVLCAVMLASCTPRSSLSLQSQSSQVVDIECPSELVFTAKRSQALFGSSDAESCGFTFQPNQEAVIHKRFSKNGLVVRYLRGAFSRYEISKDAVWDYESRKEKFDLAAEKYPKAQSPCLRFFENIKKVERFKHFYQFKLRGSFPNHKIPEEVFYQEKQNGDLTPIQYFGGIKLATIDYCSELTTEEKNEEVGCNENGSDGLVVVPANPRHFRNDVFEERVRNLDLPKDWTPPLSAFDFSETAMLAAQNARFDVPNDRLAALRYADLSRFVRTPLIEKIGVRNVHTFLYEDEIWVDKVRSDENPLAERAAYHIDRDILRFGIIPAVHVLKGSNHSIMRYVEGYDYAGKWGREVRLPISEDDYKQYDLLFKYAGETESAWEVAVFDYLTRQADHEIGHSFILADGRIVLIDNARFNFGVLKFPNMSQYLRSHYYDFLLKAGAEERARVGPFALKDGSAVYQRRTRNMPYSVWSRLFEISHGRAEYEPILETVVRTAFGSDGIRNFPVISCLFFAKIDQMLLNGGYMPILSETNELTEQCK